MSAVLEDLEVIQAHDDFEARSLSIEVGETLRFLPERREVFRARLIDSQVDIVVKSYLPHAKQTRDWGKEWKGLLRLLELGLPAPKPIAVCKGDSEKVYLLMENIEGAVNLGDFLNASTNQDSQPILEKLARLVSSVHQAGARQSDQHVDNWAVSSNGVFLLDAGTYEFEGGPLGVSQRLADLAAICATLPPHAEQSFRNYLDSHYWSEGGEQRQQFTGKAVDHAIVELQKVRARRYFKKTQRTCTEFDLKESAGSSGIYSKEADYSLVERFFSDPEAMMVEGERLKSGNTCTVQWIGFSGKTYVLKRYNVKPWWTQFRRSMSPSRARLSWANAWVLNLAFIKTARPVAFLDEGTFPRGRSYFLMEAINGELLPDYVAQHSDNKNETTSLIENVGEVWDLMGRLRAVHGDLKASNWMVDTSGEVFLIDLDSFRFGLSDTSFEAGRLKDMNRFLKNFDDMPDLADAFRARMLGGERA